MISRLLSEARRLRGRTPHELWTRATQQAHIVGERIALNVQGRVHRGDAAYRANGPVHAGSFTPAQRAMFPGMRDLRGTAQALGIVAPQAIGDLLSRAKAISDGRVELFGLGGIDVGAPPNWHCEPVAGKTAPRIHWSRIPYLNPAVLGDHKVIWEINRHQYFVTLGQVWALTGEQRWPEMFSVHLQSWLDQNPESVGVNWASSLEVSYRAISWLWALQLMRDAPAPSHALSTRMLGSLEAHGRHIERNLSTYFSPNTHLTGEALGLFYLGVSCPELRDAARWADLGAHVLENEISRQVLPDGVYFEQATQYHRYTTEIYLHYLLLAQASGRVPSPQVLEVLHRLFDVLLHLSAGNGEMPLIGDDDGGRLVQLDAKPPHDLRGLLAIGAVTLGRSDLAWAGSGDDASLVWMLGPEAVTRRDALRSTPPAITSRAFPNGGLFIMRDGWDATDGHMIIDCGPHGALSHGHSHADALAVTLAAGGRALFVDAGTFGYVGPERNAFRSTSAHNTIEVDGVSTSVPAGPFSWSRVSSPQPLAWVAAEGLEGFAGEQRGSLSTNVPVVHRRTVLHPDKGAWLVQDRIEGDGRHEIVLRWRTAPGHAAVMEGLSDGRHLIRIGDDSGPRAALLVLAPQQGTMTLEPGWFSPQYGRKEQVDVCTWRGVMEGQCVVTSLVFDDINFGTVTGVTASSHVQGAAHHAVIECTRAHVRDQFVVLVGDGSLMRHEELQLRAPLVWLQGSSQGLPESRRITALWLREMVAGNQSIIPSDGTSRWLHAHRRDAAWQVASGPFTFLPQPRS